MKNKNNSNDFILSVVAGVVAGLIVELLKILF